MQVVIFNSGIGKRMGESTKSTHKAMTPLIDAKGQTTETIFERQIRLLSAAGLKDFIITTGPFEDQIKSVFDKEEYKDLSVEFVHNPLYATTNYIYSMYLARKYIKGDVLMLHGDLVFNDRYLQLVMDAAKDGARSIGAVDKQAQQPEKDFKARIVDDKITEIAVDIFDENCYAFQPFYYLRSQDIDRWMSEVVDFINTGQLGVYAENALNQISNTVHIYGLSYSDNYVAEIDTPEDLAEVSSQILKFC